MKAKWHGDKGTEHNIIPPEVTDNTMVWYMYHHLGMTLDEIGKELGYSGMSISRQIKDTFDRKSVAKIYELQIDYCKNECANSISECRSCHLYCFMLKKMVRKRVG